MCVTKLLLRFSVNHVDVGLSAGQTPKTGPKLVEIVFMIVLSTK